MHTDRSLTYDAWALELVAQQKCCYHIICSIDKVLEDKTGSARTFGETLKTLFKDAIMLWQRYHAGGVDDYTREAQNITQTIATVLGRSRQPTPARPNWLASRRGQSTAPPRSTRGCRTDQQSGRTCPAPQRDRVKGFALLEERRQGERLCSVQDHHQDRTQTRKVSGQRAHGLVPF